MSKRKQITREELKKVVVIGSSYKPAAQDVARAVVTWLERAKIEVIPDIDGESQIDIYPVGGSGGVRLVHVEPRAFDGVDGEAKDFDPGPAAVVSFDDPLLG